MIKRLLFIILCAAYIAGCEQNTPSHSPFSSTGNTATPLTPLLPVTLPQDHASHPESMLEWWYLTANLEDEAGNPWSLQFTLFRLKDTTTPANHWQNNQRYLAHVSIHNASQHWFEERFGAGGIGNVAVLSAPFSLYIDDWQWQSDLTSPFPGTLSVSAQGIKAGISMQPYGDYVLQGNNGISQKSADGTLVSNYYSQPFLHINTAFNIDGKDVSAHGQGWYDHEWTSQLASERALGWDWFSLHLDDGSKLMAYQMHVKDAPSYTTGTLVAPDGTVTSLSASQLSLQPDSYRKVAGRELPLSWTLTLTDSNETLTIDVLKNDQWNPGSIPYYEGAIKVSGDKTGVGYMELTGY